MRILLVVLIIICSTSYADQDLDCATHARLHHVKDWEMFSKDDLDKAVSFTVENKSSLYTRTDDNGQIVGYAVPYIAVEAVSDLTGCQ